MVYISQFANIEHSHLNVEGFSQQFGCSCG